MTRKIFVFIGTAFAHTYAFAQADSLQQQINQHVWKPFIQSFNNLDTKEFMSLHSRDITRVIQDRNTLHGYETYYTETEQGNQSTIRANRKRTIELRFTQRIASGDKAFEVGYYKFTSLQPDGTSRNGYGKFHVLLRKENGTWKILMDADAAEKTDESTFQSAKPM